MRRGRGHEGKRRVWWWSREQRAGDDVSGTDRGGALAGARDLGGKRDFAPNMIEMRQTAAGRHHHTNIMWPERLARLPSARPFPPERDYLGLES